MTDLPEWAQRMDRDLAEAQQTAADTRAALVTSEQKRALLGEELHGLRADLAAAHAALLDQREELADRVGGMAVQACDEPTRVFCENLARELRRA